MQRQLDLENKNQASLMQGYYEQPATDPLIDHPQRAMRPLYDALRLPAGQESAGGDAASPEAPEAAFRLAAVKASRRAARVEFSLVAPEVKLSGALVESNPPEELAVFSPEAPQA